MKYVAGAPVEGVFVAAASITLISITAAQIVSLLGAGRPIWRPEIHYVAQAAVCIPTAG